MEYTQFVVSAVFTPFNERNEVNYDIIEKYAALMTESNLSVLVCGTTGEFCSLTLSERKKLTECWRKALPTGGKSKLIVHVGSSSVAESKELAEHAAEIKADGIAALSPYYFKPASVNVLVDCMAEIASGAPSLPFYYYNIPWFTNVDLSLVETIRKCKEKIPSLVGLKNSWNNFADVIECSKMMGNDFKVLNGSDQMILEGLVAGCNGAVGSTYQFPFMIPVYNKLFDSYHKSDLATAQKMQNHIIDFNNVIKFENNNAISIQKVLYKLHTGLDMGKTRLPLPTISAETEEKLKNVLNQYCSAIKNI